MENINNHPIIIALDFQTKREVFQFLSTFKDEKLFLKVGMELFYREGMAILTDLKKEGHQIFLDLKLHDIPTTVKRAMVQLAHAEVDLVNVHALGGQRMMEAALEGLEEGTQSGKSRPVCIAVTQLTSTSEEQMKIEQKVSLRLEDHVLHLSRLAADSKLDGVVCSAHEAKRIHREIGDHFFTVSPGIRLKEDGSDDQKRIMTPQDAKKETCDSIVVGRGITRALNPKEAYLAYKKEWRGYV